MTNTPVKSLNRRGARLIRRFVTAHPFPTVVSVLGAIAFAAAAVGATMVIGRVTDELIVRSEGSRPGSDLVWRGVALIVVVGIARGLSVVVRRYFAAMLEARMQVTLREQVTDRYLDVPLSYHLRMPAGELLAHADADVSGTTMLIKPLPFTIGLVALVVFSIASLLGIDWTFMLIALALFPTLTLINRAYTKRVEVPSAEVQRKIGVVSSVAHESFDGALVVKTLGLEGYESARFAAAANALRQERLSVGRLRASFEPLLDALPNLGIVALLLVGSARLNAGALTTGDIVAGASLFGILAFPMRVFGFFLEELPRAVVSIERVDAVLAEPVDPAIALHDTTQLPSGPLSVAVDNLCFSYLDAPVLKRLSFTVAPGERVALVGATGSGKSTVAAMLLRLIEPDSGEVRLGGVRLSECSATEISGRASIVFQEPFLFASTIGENLLAAYGEGEPLGAEQAAKIAGSDPVVQHAVEVAQVQRFVHKLELGWATPVGERGITLSGGQKQRLALARALVREPILLVLDDASSAVDPTIEAVILAGLATSSCTTIIVAHRLSTIRSADRVLYLSDGTLLAEGQHEELLQRSDYAALVSAYAAEGASAAEGPVEELESESTDA